MIPDPNTEEGKREIAHRIKKIKESDINLPPSSLINT